MEKKDLRIIFMGTPEFAVESLRQLVEGGYNVVAVVTQPDKPVGRHGSVLHASAVKEYALSKGLPVLQPVKMKDPDFIEQLRSYHADLQVVVAFRMLPEVVWAMPRFGTFNVHAALLPQYRGAAPINWAVINGETKTGVTTFFLDHDIDTGRIIMKKEFAIPDDADVEYVYDGLMMLGADICKETVDAVLETDGDVPSVAQDDSVTLRPAPKIFKETCLINWHQDAKKVYDFVRGLSPYPGAWCEIAQEGGKPVVMKIFKTAKTGKELHPDNHTGDIAADNGRLFVAAADSWLEITELQLAGKKRMNARDFLNGYKQIENFKISSTES
ncbi:MAG: methionyl-tRNA formyltransferase [Prevotellaceae bacterium]|nr:methionyl-tRNA formyltransferase [Prevotellaceae bacterium]